MASAWPYRSRSGDALGATDQNFGKPVLVTTGNATFRASADLRLDVEFDLREAEITLTSVLSNKTVHLRTHTFRCKGGRILPIPDEWAIDRLNYRFAFYTCSGMPDEMSVEQHYVQIEGRYNGRPSLCIRGLARAWLQSLLSEIDVEFSEPPIIEFLEAPTVVANSNLYVGVPKSRTV